MLSADSLRFYKDSIAEEVYFIFIQHKNSECFLSNGENVLFFCSQASDLEGEIDLTKCLKVCEYQVQRNYGFQIHVREALKHSDHQLWV